MIKLILGLVFFLLGLSARKHSINGFLQIKGHFSQRHDNSRMYFSHATERMISSFCYGFVYSIRLSILVGK